MMRVLILAALLAGCGPTTKQVYEGAAGQDPMVFTDRVTGCQYLTTQDRVTLTPRVSVDGMSHMGCKKVEH